MSEREYDPSDIEDDLSDEPSADELDRLAAEMESDEDLFRDDVEADADVLSSIGWGTDEDYGSFGGDEW